MISAFWHPLSTTGIKLHLIADILCLFAPKWCSLYRSSSHLERGSYITRRLQVLCPILPTLACLLDYNIVVDFFLHTSLYFSFVPPLTKITIFFSSSFQEGSVTDSHVVERTNTLLKQEGNDPDGVVLPRLQTF